MWNRSLESVLRPAFKPVVCQGSLTTCWKNAGVAPQRTHKIGWTSKRTIPWRNKNFLLINIFTQIVLIQNDNQDSLYCFIIILRFFFFLLLLCFCVNFFFFFFYLEGLFLAIVNIYISGKGRWRYPSFGRNLNLSPESTILMMDLHISFHLAQERLF